MDNISYIVRYSVVIVLNVIGLREEESNRWIDRKSIIYIYDFIEFICILRNVGMFKFYRECFCVFILWDCVFMKNVYMYWYVEFYINECMGKKMWLIYIFCSI